MLHSMSNIFGGCVAALMLSLLSACASAPAPTENLYELERIDAHLGEMAVAGSFSGVVLIARGEEVLLERGYGWADLENEQPLTPHHVFRYGSLTKSMTASGILAAIREGRFDLDDGVCNWIANCPAAWGPVTVRHLLNQSSGIPDHGNEMADVPLSQARAEVERLLALIDRGEALSFPPGQGFAYGNFNYILLGYILEREFELPWDEIMSALVFVPSAAVGIRYDDVWALVPGRARGYSRNRQGLIRNAEYRDHGAYSAGGLAGSARDLFAWSHAFLSEALVGHDLTQTALAAGPGGYGFGWNIGADFGRSRISQSGGMFGFASHVAHYPDDRLTIIVLSNIDADSAMSRACEAAALWFGVGAQSSPSPQPPFGPQHRCS
jgi:CubicO group peptidase (beta-lactamase class C family)